MNSESKIRICMRRVFSPDMGDTASAVQTKWVLRAAYLYLALPFVIFALGWMRLYIGIPAALAVCACLYFALRDAPEVSAPRLCRKTAPYLCATVLVIVLIVLFSGIGGFSYQNRDHYWRNAIFETLCRYQWPVRNTWKNGTTVGLIYYIGYWLPAAVFGKCFGVGAGYVFLLLWTILGVLLFTGVLTAYLKKHSLWVLLLFFSFSGMDVLVHLFHGNTGMLFGFAHLEWGASTFQYSSFTTQLYWAFNQALPAWIFTLAILLQKNNRYIVLLLGLMPLCSALPFIGLLPFAVYLMLSRVYSGEDGEPLHGKARWTALCRDTLTVPNILGGGVSGILSALYLFGNARLGGGQNDGGKGLHLVFTEYASVGEFLAAYLPFVILEFLLYWLLLFPYRRHQPMYYLTMAVLLLVPLPALGLGYDFCMRASIPGLLILFLMLAQTLPQMIADCRGAGKWRQRVLTACLAVCLLIGLRTPFNEIARSVRETARGNRFAGTFELMQSKTDENFVQPADNSFFYRYIARGGKGNS